MPLEPREVEIESLKTPKGDVPTVKGLETAVNTVYTEIASLNTHLSKIEEFLTQISQSLMQINEQLDKQSSSIRSLGETFADLIVQLAQNESLQEHYRDFSRKQLIIEKADLLALKEELSSILERLKDQVTENES
ncbi:MAG: hypothetical protein ACFFB2_11785 [Promethearchaeota archaeon]